MAHIREVPRANNRVAYEVHWRQNGKKQQQTFKTETQADRWVDRIELELSQGNNTSVHTQRKTVKAVVEAVMVVSEAKLKPRTLKSYRSTYDCHVLPAFGTWKITSLTPEEVENWVARLSAAGLKPATVRNIYVALNKACRYALRHGWITSNPCAGVELPRFAADGSAPFEPKFLSPAQVEALAAHLAEKAPHFGLLVRMAAYTGLRAGELAALRVRDVNLFRRHVEVRRTVHRKKGEGWIYTAPKSKRSSRNVPLRASLVGELGAYLATHPHRNNPEAPLWPGQKAGGYTHGKRGTRGGGADSGTQLDWSRTFDIGNFYKHRFKPALESVEVVSAGLPMDLRFHDLRHTYASIMAAAGVELRKVSRWMGHASINTTDSIYTHLFHSDYTDDMARVDAFAAADANAQVGGASVTQLRGVVGGS
ncbi:tyrosine-type recombinase/integrase [Streptomyces sp. NBC_00035]|uniref:tyrosine-type recombinase/integrase n=1 Tax=Streptomyces sp. NBC_00035 TaxID=2903614 RepID=UPI00324672D0